MKELRIRAVFLGAPGAGKGTQAKMLAQHGVCHVSSGDMLREQRDRDSDFGRKLRGFMDRGALVPDELIIEMVIERLSSPEVRNSWILDGFPRTLPQAQFLDAALERDATRTLTHVVFFAIPSDRLVQRLTGRRTCARPSCGAIWHVEFKRPRVDGVCDTCGAKLAQRPDDDESVVRQRLDAYNTQTKPLLGYYRGKGLLVSVDADRSPAEVFASVLAEISRA